jgi:hypothetical protein
MRPSFLGALRHVIRVFGQSNRSVYLRDKEAIQFPGSVNDCRHEGDHAHASPRSTNSLKLQRINLWTFTGKP